MARCAGVSRIFYTALNGRMAGKNRREKSLLKVPSHGSILFHEPSPSFIDVTGELFEQSAIENGQPWWSAEWLMQTLGYKDHKAFSNVINDAIGSCMRLGVSVLDTSAIWQRS